MHASYAATATTARLEPFLAPECVPPPTAPFTVTTDVVCYNISLATSYKAYLLNPVPVTTRCDMLLFTYPDCVEVSNDSGPLKLGYGRCIEIPNVPYGAQSVALVCTP